MTINEQKLNDFMSRFVGDLGAVMHAATMVVGDQLGLFKALADGPSDVEDLAYRTNTDARYLRECCHRRQRAVMLNTMPKRASLGSTKSKHLHWQRWVARHLYLARSRLPSLNLRQFPR